MSKFDAVIILETTFPKTKKHGKNPKKSEGFLSIEPGYFEVFVHMTAEYNYLVPLDLGAKGSCMIGRI